MSKPKMTDRFQFRLILAFSALMLLFLSLTAVIDVFGIPGTQIENTYVQSRTKSLEQMEVVSGLLSHRIAVWVQERRVDLAGFAASPLFQMALHHATPGSGVLDGWTEGYMQTHPQTEALVILLPGEEKVLSTGGQFAGKRTLIGVDISEEMYEQYFKPGYSETIEIHHHKNGDAHLRIARQVTSAQQPGIVLGVIVQECELRHILFSSAGISSDLLPKNWGYSLYTSNGVLLKQQNALVWNDDSLSHALMSHQQITAGLEGPFDGYDKVGHHVLGYYRQIRVAPGIRLGLLVKQNWDLAMKEVWYKVALRTFIFLALLAVAIGFTFLFARRIAKPIEELTQIAREVESGNLYARVPKPDKSEVGELGRVFNAMIQKVETWQVELEGLVSSRTNELSRVTKRQEAILSAVHDLIMEFDTHLRCTWSNSAGLEFFGNNVVKRESLFSQVQFLHPVLQGIQSDMYFEKEHENDKGQLRTLAWWFTAIRNNHGACTGVLASARDITEQKRVEGEVRSLGDQLLQAQKLDSIGRLAGGVAHDFNNMLTVIRGHAEMSLAITKAGTPLHASLDEILKAAVRSAELTQQLLAFARKQSVIPRVLDLNEAVEGVLKMIQRLIGEQVNLKWTKTPNLWAVKIDPSQLQQMLVNLCVNSRDAITGPGEICIDMENVTISPDTPKVCIECVDGEFVCIRVQDNGCGMTPETIAHIFEPFYTTKELGKGTGLGLAMVYGAVKQNDGFLHVESEINKGTTFSIYLPKSKVDSPTQAAAKNGVTSAHTLGRILFVEDEVMIQKMAQKFMEHFGYKVTVARTPKEAVAFVNSNPNDFDLLMTDVIMPEVNGKELLEQIQRVVPHIRHLFISGYTADIISNHGILAHDTHFLQKPFSAEELHQKLLEIFKENPV